MPIKNNKTFVVIALNNLHGSSNFLCFRQHHTAPEKKKKRKLKVRLAFLLVDLFLIFTFRELQEFDWMTSMKIRRDKC